MLENPRTGRQARNFKRNVPKILDLESSSEQVFFLKINTYLIQYGGQDVEAVPPLCDLRRQRSIKYLRL